MMDRMDFIAESNRIEGIFRSPTPEEREEFDRFMELENPLIADLVRFVSVYQPSARLRDLPGLDVRVGRYIPPRGGPLVRTNLTAILTNIRLRTPHENHLRYEHLHPFTDGNGRSGRMLWAWQMREIPRGFLHQFYYQTLAAARQHE